MITVFGTVLFSYKHLIQAQSKTKQQMVVFCVVCVLACCWRWQTTMPAPKEEALCTLHHCHCSFHQYFVKGRKSFGKIFDNEIFVIFHMTYSIKLSTSLFVSWAEVFKIKIGSNDRRSIIDLKMRFEARMIRSSTFVFGQLDYTIFTGLVWGSDDWSYAICICVKKFEL